MTRAVLLLGMTLLAMWLGGCTTTKIFSDHPLMAKNQGTPQAQIYFLRPMPQRTRGVSDTDLKIELEQTPLMELSRGEYSLVKIKPAETDVIVRSMTHLTTKPLPQQVWRARHYQFESGKTYYILARLYQEEFRGIYFVPELISEAEARELAKHMKPAGKLAEEHPLYQEPEPSDEGISVDSLLDAF